MKEVRRLSVFKRLGCLAMALIMVLGLLPMTSPVHAVDTDKYTITFYKTNVRQHGDHVTFKYADVDKPASGEKVTLKIVPNGEAGTAWFAIYAGLHNMETDYTEKTPLLKYDVASKSGGFSSNWKSKGGIDFNRGDYTIVVFGAEGSYEPDTYITFTVTREVKSSSVVEPATCTKDGIQHEVYTDDAEADVIIPALGHNATAWAPVETANTHSRVCSNEGCGALTEDCSFADGVCTVCGGAEGRTEVKAPVTLTNKAGEKTDTFFVGEPIYVETNGFTSSDWISLWYYNGGWESTYRLWWYATDEKMLLWDAVWTDGFAWDGMNMPAGTYYLYYAESEELASFTLVDPDASVTAEKSLTFAVDDKKVSIDAINYSEYSQVSVTNAEGMEMYQFFCLGRNGLTMECELIPGEYTISMYNDYYKADLQEQKTFTIQGDEVALLATDKTEYKFGEPIMVTSQLGNPNWLGLYKQDDTNIVDGGTTSLFWLYPTVGQPVNILSGDQQRPTEYKAGTYKVLLLDANYGVVASVENIVITAEIDESKTVVVPATCEKDGTITYTYTDGTTKVVTYPEDETLKALGHDYTTLRPQFNEENLQHTLICNNDNTHTVIENCSWDEGVEIEQPTADKDGKKEFTCFTCGGHRYENISAKEIDREEVINLAKCDEPGTKRIHYTDGSYEDVEIPKLNHAYPATWTYNNDKATHSKVCGNDPAHVETANCSFESSAIPGGTRYTCSVCSGSYDVIIMSTNKTAYALGEPILVTVDSSVYSATSTDWVGIWENNLTYTNDVSLYYHYPSSLGATANVLDGVYQRGAVGVGTYVLRLFAADGYDEITNLTITVGPAVRDESKTVRVEPTCETDGSITYYLTNGAVDTVITAAEDETLKRLGHAYPETWTHVADTETHKRVCANNPEHVETNNCVWDEGVETVPPTADQKGEMKYTCTVCGGTRTEDIPVLSATEIGRQTFEPTCKDQGYTLITYSDGSTRKVDFVPALDHDFAGAYTHLVGTHTHSQECQRADCDEVEITNCELETDGVPNGDGYQYSCLKCGEWTENIILTDKSVYAYGEDIIVSVHPNYVARLGGTDWIGLYFKGESPNPDMNPTSIRWNYAGDFVGGKSIYTTSNYDRPSVTNEDVLKSGNYVLYLCANDGYSVLARTYITIVAEEDPSKTVIVAPTCTEDGTITYYNVDGNVSRVVTAAEDANLKAHGHTFGSWSYDGIEKQTHTHTCICTVCEEPCGVSEAKPCQWDDGVETKPATETETGIKTYTCRDCSGTKEETLPKLNVTVTGTETVDATCDDPGYTRTHYSDGTFSDEVIPAKGHDYSDWTYNVATRDHSKICANDAAHVITEACDMSKTVVDNSINYSCSICGGGYATGLVETDKTVYDVTDPIMVTVHKTYSGAWVGLYKEGELFDPNNGGIASLFWTYVSEGMVGVPFDITAVTNGVTSGHRGEKLGNGKYVLVFFGDSGYTDVIDTVEIEIFTDMSNTKFDLLFYKAEVRPNGYHKRFQLKEVDNPSGGEKVTLGVNVTSGVVGSSWVGVFEGDFDLDTDFTGITPIVQKYIADIDGKTPFTLNWKSKGGFEFYVGNFTVVIFADATTNSPVQYVTFEVYRPIVEGSEVILRQPSCDAPGLKMVDYVDDENPDTQDQGVMVILPALGHDLGELAHIEGTNTHGKTCKRENCEYVEAEACQSEGEGVVTKQPTALATGEKTFTCDTCSGTYTEIIPMVTYEGGERVYGASRYNTAIQIADTLKEALGVEKFDTIVVASGLEFADALSGTYLANKKNAPILLIRNRADDLAMVKGYIHENLIPGGTVYLLGGIGAVSKAMETGLEGFNVKRLGGANRYDTNLLILQEAGVTPGEDILICTGKNFADSLSASALNKPILLVKDTLTTAQTDFLRSVNGSKIYIIGGNVAVNDRISAVLSLYGQTARISGENRYETSVRIANTFFADAKNVVLAYGDDFPDGLCGGTLASSMNAPVILVANGEDKNAMADAYTASKGITAGIVLGGDGRINNDVMQNVFQ